ncbi:hypothetical protein FDP41_002665 [Naegleria fowleri]|uniref:F-box domain-containing protein n=1 Tax=Naegleria fowleri TaxID=5763 RepID=A0A6A5BWX6_NAEFO|nr:uncharacterized protein FDP41_002665 [Naegleria fowleri]KAF0978150.1 hypothetical protein FDP41_002665 [Naegleria fowleri]CAG4718840.1 unnamed protein product [Naegleria fowleri]
MIIDPEKKPSSSNYFPVLVLIHIANYIPLSQLVKFQLVCSEWYYAIEELQSGEFWNYKFLSYYWEKLKFYEKFSDEDDSWGDKTIKKRLKYVEKNQQMTLKKLEKHKNFSRQQLKNTVISEWYQYFNTFFKEEGKGLGSTEFYNVMCNLPEKSRWGESKIIVRAKQFWYLAQHFPQVIEKFMSKKSYRVMLPLMQSNSCTNQQLEIICEKFKPCFDYITASFYFDKISLRLPNPLSTGFMKYILKSYQTFRGLGMKELFVGNCHKLIPLSQRKAELELFIEHVTLHRNGRSIQDIIYEKDFVEIIHAALNYQASIHDISILSEKLGREVPTSILNNTPPSEDFFCCCFNLELHKDNEQLSQKLHEKFSTANEIDLLEQIVLENDINLFKCYDNHNIMVKILSFHRIPQVERLIILLKKQAEKNNNKYGYFEGDLINWKMFDPCGIWMHNLCFKSGLTYNVKYTIHSSTWLFIKQSNAILHHATLIVVAKNIALPEIIEYMKQRTRVFLDELDMEGVPLSQFMLEHFNKDIAQMELAEIREHLFSFRVPPLMTTI